MGDTISPDKALKGVFGCRREVVSEMFTRDRLQGIAQKLDIAPGGDFSLGLTWLAPPSVILDLAEETVIIGRYTGMFTDIRSTSMALAVQAWCHILTTGERGCGQLRPAHVQGDGASTVWHWDGRAGLDPQAVDAHVQVPAGERVWAGQAGAGGLGLPGALAQLVEGGGCSVRRQPGSPCHLSGARRLLHVSPRLSYCPPTQASTRPDAHLDMCMRACIHGVLFPRRAFLPS